MTSIRHMRHKLTKTKHEWICVPTSRIYLHLVHGIHACVYMCLFLWLNSICIIVYVQTPAPCICELFTLGAPLFPPLFPRSDTAILGLWQKVILIHPESSFYWRWAVWQFGGVVDQPSWFCSIHMEVDPCQEVWGQQMIYCHLQMNVKA